MKHSNLTIVFQKGRRGTIIGKIVELPHLVTRAATLDEVRAQLVALLAQQSKATLVRR